MTNTISELFFSLEGESRYTFHPTVYVRYSRCNFKCPHFNNPNKDVLANGYANLGFDPSTIIDILKMPVIEKGCDSQYAVNPEFAHTWKAYKTDELAQALVDLIPHNQWQHPETGLDVICSLTGGEPTMNQDEIIDLINHPLMANCKHYLIETNGSVPLSNKFIEEINRWKLYDSNRIWTWSNSPKLSNSGEMQKRAIRPKVLLSQQQVKNYDQYLKFVSSGTVEEIAEIKEVINIYKTDGVKIPPVWLMPMACTGEQQRLIAQKVAKICMDNGWLYSHRIQNDLWDNAIGT